jgi:Flp pilus assembly protein TadG
MISSRFCRSGPARAHISDRCVPSLHPRPSSSGRDRGSVTVELVLLAPVLLSLLLFVVYVGRLAQANTHVRHAAAEAARAASLVDRSRMDSVARSAALADLSDNGVACRGPRVAVMLSDSDTVQSVAVEVTCEVDREDLVMLGLGAQRVSASSSQVIDVYRGQR